MTAKWRRRWRFLLRIPLHFMRWIGFSIDALCNGYEHMLDSVEHDLILARPLQGDVESEAPASSHAHWRRGPEDDQAPNIVPIA